MPSSSVCTSILCRLPHPMRTPSIRLLQLGTLSHVLIDATAPVHLSVWFTLGQAVVSTTLLSPHNSLSNFSLSFSIYLYLPIVICFLLDLSLSLSLPFSPSCFLSLSVCLSLFPSLCLPFSLPLNHPSPFLAHCHPHCVTLTCCCLYEGLSPYPLNLLSYQNNSAYVPQIWGWDQGRCTRSNWKVKDTDVVWWVKLWWSERGC